MIDCDNDDDDDDDDEIQGPFRDSREVQYLRSRPPCPTIRCDSNYFALDEVRKQHQLDDWVQRITDDKYEHHLSLVLFSFVRSFVIAGRGPAYSVPQR